MRANYPAPLKTMTVGERTIEIPANWFAFNRLTDHLADVYGYNADGMIDLTDATNVDGNLHKFASAVTNVVSAVEFYVLSPDYATKTEVARETLDQVAGTSQIMDSLLLLTAGLEDAFDRDVHRAAQQYGISVRALTDIMSTPGQTAQIARQAMHDLMSVDADHMPV